MSLTEEVEARKFQQPLGDSIKIVNLSEKRESFYNKSNYPELPPEKFTQSSALTAEKKKLTS